MSALALYAGMGSLCAAIGVGAYAAVAAQPTRAVAAAGATGDRLPASVGSAAPATDSPPSTLTRWAAATASKLGRRDQQGRLQHRLDLAGNPERWQPQRVQALKGFGVIGGAVLGVLFGAQHGIAATVLFTLALAGFGMAAPDLVVRNLGEKRQLTLQQQLPDAMDMLTVCVEAGLGFDAALARVARNVDGPMAQESARVLQEMQVGKSRTEALRALVERTDVAELNGFVSAMVQAGDLGISIGDVLREQSREMRMARRHRAEEKAQKLQVKLLAPLITCLLPAMFVVILGPAVINIMHFFSTVN